MANRKYVKAVVHDRRNSAEKAQGARRGVLDDRVAAAQKALDQAQSRVRDDDQISLQLPDPGVPAGRRIARLLGSDGRETILQGAERMGLTGPNGVGKTTLLEQLIAALGSYRGALIVVSHDRAFLERLNLNAELSLDVMGVLTRADGG